MYPVFVVCIARLVDKLRTPRLACLFVPNTSQWVLEGMSLRDSDDIAVVLRVYEVVGVAAGKVGGLKAHTGSQIFGLKQQPQLDDTSATTLRRGRHDPAVDKAQGARTVVRHSRVCLHPIWNRNITVSQQKNAMPGQGGWSWVGPSAVCSLPIKGPASELRSISIRQGQSVSTQYLYSIVDGLSGTPPYHNSRGTS
jgi:hypothetical protein